MTGSGPFPTGFLADGPPDAAATIMLAHGAGAPMDTLWMNAIAGAIALFIVLAVPISAVAARIAGPISISVPAGVPGTATIPASLASSRFAARIVIRRRAAGISGWIGVGIVDLRLFRYPIRGFGIVTEYFTRARVEDDFAPMPR